MRSEPKTRAERRRQAVLSSCLLVAVLALFSGLMTAHEEGAYDRDSAASLARAPAAEWNSSATEQNHDEKRSHGSHDDAPDPDSKWGTGPDPAPRPDTGRRNSSDDASAQSESQMASVLFIS